jgi:uncharacterized damage-inducible protein DinB
MTELERLLAYDDWANRQALASLKRAPSPAGCRRMAHILGAQRVWLSRVAGGAPGEVWPAADLAACEAGIEELGRRWRDVAGKDDPDRVVAYRNTKGERFENTVREILLQILFHGAHHRGQIASDVRAHGGEPALTDFIHASREGIV